MHSGDSAFKGPHHSKNADPPTSVTTFTRPSVAMRRSIGVQRARNDAGGGTGVTSPKPATDMSPARAVLSILVGM